MAHFYFDADTQVKRYLAEKGGEWIKALLDATNDGGEPAHEFYTVDISQVEVASAIAAAYRTQRIDADTREEAFELHIAESAETYQHLIADAVIQADATCLTQKYPLKAIDAIHVATALQLNRTLSEYELSLTLVSGDHQVLTAAKAEGLPTENPNTHE